MLSTHLGANVLYKEPLCLVTGGVGVTETLAGVFVPLHARGQCMYIHAPDPELWTLCPCVMADLAFPLKQALLGWMNARDTYLSFLPSWMAPRMEGGRKEAVRLSRKVSWGCRREKKESALHPAIHPVPAECSANKTLNSADTGIDFVHSFVSAGYESLCLQVSFIKSLEGS